MSNSLQINGVSLSTHKFGAYKSKLTTSKYSSTCEKKTNHQIYLKMLNRKKNQSLHPLNLFFQRLLIHPDSYADSNSHYKGTNPNFDLAFNKYKKYQNIFASSGRINEIPSLPKIPTLSKSISSHNFFSLPSIVRGKIINPTKILKLRPIQNYGSSNNQLELQSASQHFETSNNRIQAEILEKKKKQSKAIQCNMQNKAESDSQDMNEYIEDYKKLIQNRKLILIDELDAKYSSIKMKRKNFY